MERLKEILATMDIPPMRVNDLGWLQRNIQINNGEHPDIETALQLIKQQWKENK
mgnify:CR=1 FL=1|jgi:hypothetical protein